MESNHASIPELTNRKSCQARIRRWRNRSSALQAVRARRALCAEVVGEQLEDLVLPSPEPFDARLRPPTFAPTLPDDAAAIAYLAAMAKTNET
jgi:hypothetical protein